MKLEILCGVALMALALAVAPAAASAASSADELSANARRGRAAMDKAECTRCHTVTDAEARGRGLAPAPRAKNCVACHTWILGTKDDPAAIERYREQYPEWDRYLTNVVHYTKLPDLGTLTRRVRPSFIRAYLDGPYDMRPHLDESMIQVQLSATDKDAVVAYLSELNDAEETADDAEPPSAEHVADGRARFERAGCASCHLVGNSKFSSDYDAAFYTAMKPRALLAPNLRHVRKRMTRAVLVRHITDPKAVDPAATMPKPEIDAETVERIADFLLHGELDVGAPAAPLSVADVPDLERKVSYDEVFDKVLGRICVHCHMNPDSNGGDGGPGNTGGLGWTGVQLDLETYDGLRTGMVRDGKRVSVLEPEAAGEPPLLLNSLMRRHEEAGRDYRTPYADSEQTAPSGGGRPGMPLGLPPLDVSDLSLMKAWLAQGALGPTR